MLKAQRDENIPVIANEADLDRGDRRPLVARRLSVHRQLQVLRKCPEA